MFDSKVVSHFCESCSKITKGTYTDVDGVSEKYGTKITGVAFMCNSCGNVTAHALGTTVDDPSVCNKIITCTSNDPDGEVVWEVGVGLDPAYYADTLLDNINGVPSRVNLDTVISIVKLKTLAMIYEELKKINR